jgi:hypothetical protein
MEARRTAADYGDPISAGAEPQLRQEALQAQSALRAALDAAHL